MNLKPVFTVLAAVGAAAAFAADFTPYWQQSVIEEEPVLFYLNKRKQATGTLMTEPVEIIKVANRDGSVIYQENVDYTIDKAARKITLTPNSRIVPVTEEELYPEPNAPMSYGKKAGSEKYMFYSEGPFLPDHQVRFTYRVKQWDLPVPQTHYGRLAKLGDKLKKGENIEFAVFGDSISCGCNATSYINIAPFQPTQYERFANFLRAAGKGTVKYHNFSVGGKCAEWGVQNLKGILELPQAPDFVILAWGMNDASGNYATDKYIGFLREQMNQIHQKFPQTEFILLSTMTANPAWQYAGTSHFDEYSQALRTLAADGVLIADMTPAWKDILTRKSYLSLSGNGLNHPNDFGHKLYADVLFDAVNQSSLK